MEQPEDIACFSLLGGPLHGLGRRLGLVRGDSNTIPLGLALGLGAWCVLVALAMVQGAGHRLISLLVIAAHVRLLVAIPLFFVCEWTADPRMRAFVSTLVHSGVVSREALPKLNLEITRIARWRDSWLPDATCLLVTVLWSIFGLQVVHSGITSAFQPGGSGAQAHMATWWYWVVCLPLFRFLLLRWLFRLILWLRFLARVASGELHLVPTHPDGAAGLGYLEITQTHFLPLAFALAALQAAVFAEEITSGTSMFEAIYPGFGIALLVIVVLFVGPGVLFLPKLWACRVKGLSEYMSFASSYVSSFDRKWVSGGGVPGEPLLGTPDLQSLADLGNSINLVRNMRVIPASLGLLRDVVIVAVLPMLPLLLLKYPIADLTRKLFEKLVGM